jgi:hypothetical protein
MAATTLPPCGIYRTTRPIGDIPANRFVYFHNHGDPGPGVYLPTRWAANRAEFGAKGQVLPDSRDASFLHPLPAEGLYRVTKQFQCCPKRCTTFEPDALVQLGYNGEGRAIVFVPEFTTSGITIPASGSAVDDDRLQHLAPLKVAEARHRHAEPNPMLH